MELEPCPQCRRHVATDATACPFCAAALAAQPARFIAAGRWSRAAIFAGATLAACHPAPQTNPPPPNGSDTEQHYAQPPPSAGTGTIHGVVTDGRKPLAGVPIRLQPTEQSTSTNARGEFTFADLPPGDYTVVFHDNGNPRQGPNLTQVKVEADKIVEASGVIYPEPVDNGPCCKPYGAPPARRRIV